MAFEKMKKKVLVGLSGGVDSTVTAILLKKEGYVVEGVYMKLHHKPGYHEENFEKVKRVGEYLDIPVHFYDLSEAFQEEVYDYFVESYQKGLTPNPCVKCNRTIKFGKMVAFAEQIGADFIATGHYVKCDGQAIYKAKDDSKDQSYFLAQVNKSVLPKLMFPLGEWLKSDVKAFANTIELLQDIATQKESSEICFVEKSYEEILERHMSIDRPGEVVNSSGEVVGDHKGYMHYTIGKRRGFFVDGAHDPHFVLAIKPKQNQIVVGKKEELAVDTFEIKEVNLFEDKTVFEVEVKIRYRTEAVPCKVVLDDTFTQGKVMLKEPVYGLAMGQIAAFYKEDRLLGGGVIC
jgi:tRNA-specific 2-thiouridylase